MQLVVTALMDTLSSVSRLHLVLLALPCYVLPQFQATCQASLAFCTWAKLTVKLHLQCVSAHAKGPVQLSARDKAYSDINCLQLVAAETTTGMSISLAYS